MLNEKRTQKIMKSKFLIFLPVAAMLLLFSNCGNKTSSEQTATELKDSVSATQSLKEEAVPDSVTILKDVVYDVVDTPTTFPGGAKVCLEFIAKNIKYPPQAIENKEEGQVVVQFIVSKNGKLLNPIVVKSVSPLLDAEAIRVINSMPDWIPGKHKGENVNSRFTLPVRFRLK